MDQNNFKEQTKSSTVCPGPLTALVWEFKVFQMTPNMIQTWSKMEEKHGGVFTVEDESHETGESEAEAGSKSYLAWIKWSAK